MDYRISESLRERRVGRISHTHTHKQTNTHTHLLAGLLLLAHLPPQLREVLLPLLQLALQLIKLVPHEARVPGPRARVLGHLDRKQTPPPPTHTHTHPPRSPNTPSQDSLSVKRTFAERFDYKPMRAHNFIQQGCASRSSIQGNTRHFLCFFSAKRTVNNRPESRGAMKSCPRAQEELALILLSAIL